MDKIDVINNGYIALVESWGSDERIIEAARMSTDKGFKGWGSPSIWVCSNCGHHVNDAHIELVKAEGKHTDAHEITNQPNNGIAFCPNKNCIDFTLVQKDGTTGDEKLLRYLYEHQHMTPFEMAGCIIEVQAPIFVFREWHRHRTQSYNELSARYTELPNLFYMPSDDRIKAGRQSTTNKQASDTTILGRDFHEMTTIQGLFFDAYQSSRETYEELLKMGIARELARMVIPVAQISRMRASANLRNWLAFLTLRMDPAAQFEIRQYANALGELIAQRFPHTWELFKTCKWELVKR